MSERSLENLCKALGESFRGMGQQSGGTCFELEKEQTTNAFKLSEVSLSLK